MEHRRVCFRMLSLLPLVQISKLSQANSLLFGKVCCRTPRGVRGLKCEDKTNVDRVLAGRTPRGVRGLKCKGRICTSDVPESRTPRGVRGLKFREREVINVGHVRRTPRGVRGLKYWLPVVEDVKGYVAPLAGCVD